MDYNPQGIERGTWILNQVLDTFNSCVDVLIAEIRKINIENQDREMAELKTKRMIQKWFKHGGRIPRG